jgi:hypothetical protein
LGCTGRECEDCILGEGGKSGSLGNFLRFSGADVSNFVIVMFTLVLYPVQPGKLLVIDNVSPTYGGVPEVKHVVSITSASYAALGTKDPNTLYVVSGSVNSLTSTFPYTGSAIISGSLTVTGSIEGSVVSASISSNTASLDFSLGNFFTCLITGSTFFNIINTTHGQVVNLLLTTVQNSPSPATASFSSNVRQVSGSRYLPTSGSSGKEDILTFITFSSSSVYLAKINDLR